LRHIYISKFGKICRFGAPYPTPAPAPMGVIFGVVQYSMLPLRDKKTQNRPVTEVNTTAYAACNTGSKNVFTPSVPHSHLGSVNPLCRTLCSCAAVAHWHVMFVLNVIAVILWILLSIYVIIYLFICIHSSIIRPHRSYRSRRF